MPPPQLYAAVRAFGEPPTQQVIRDQITGAVTVINRRAGTIVLENNLGSLTTASNFRCTASELDPGQASIVGTHRFLFRREDGVYDVVAESTIEQSTGAACVERRVAASVVAADAGTFAAGPAGMPRFTMP